MLRMKDTSCDLVIQKTSLIAALAYQGWLVQYRRRSTPLTEETPVSEFHDDPSADLWAEALPMLSQAHVYILSV